MTANKMTKKRILFVSPAYPPFPGGGERYVRSLAVELVRQGHEVTAVTSHAQREHNFWQGATSAITQAWDEGVWVWRCPIGVWPGGFRALLAWRKGMVVISQLLGPRGVALLSQMARRIPPIRHLPLVLSDLPGPFDVVHGFNISWEWPLLAGWQWAQAHQVPFVATPFAHFGEEGRDRVARNSTMAHQLSILRGARQVLGLTAVETAGFARLGISSERLGVIGGGLDPLPAAPPLPEMAVKESERPFALFVGRLSYEKGALAAVQAVQALRQSGLLVELVLVGQMTAEFEQFWHKTPSDQRQGIRPLGVVSEAEKHALLRKCALFLLPSRTDSFGIVLLEAWAYGKPVIGARAGGIPGVIDDNENGLLVSFGDVAALSKAIKQLWTNPHWAEQLGKQGQAKTNRQYQWEFVAEKVLNAYQKAEMPL